MLKQRIYVDTSVIGGCLDEEFKLYSTQLFDAFMAGKKQIVLSDLVQLELEGAPSIERVDVLVSWNFKHIVNLNRIRLINSVNLKMGYPMLEIRNPAEVLDED